MWRLSAPAHLPTESDLPLPMDGATTERFTLLWIAAQPTLDAFVHSLVPEFQQAEEVVQRVAVALVRKFDQYDSTRPFAAWAIGVAKYEVLYFRRERASDRHLFNDELVDQVALSYQCFVEDVDPFREALGRCMEQIEGKARRALELRYSKGLNMSAVGREMELTPGAARMLLCRVRQVLRTCIEQRLGEARRAAK